MRSLRRYSDARSDFAIGISVAASRLMSAAPAFGVQCSNADVWFLGDQRQPLART